MQPSSCRAQFWSVTRSVFPSGDNAALWKPLSETKQTCRTWLGLNKSRRLVFVLLFCCIFLRSEDLGRHLNTGCFYFWLDLYYRLCFHRHHIINNIFTNTWLVSMMVPHRRDSAAAREGRESFPLCFLLDWVGLPPDEAVRRDCWQQWIISDAVMS